MKKIFLILTAITITFLFSGTGYSAGHMKEGMHDKESTEKMHSVKKELSQDGIKAKFHFMTMGEHMKEMESMGKGHKMMMDMDKGKSSTHSHKMKDGKKVYHTEEHKELSHHAAIELINEKTGKQIENAKVDLTITSPSGKTETKKLSTMKMMGITHYYLDADLKEKGNYLFEFFVNIKDNETKFSFEEKIQ